MTISLPMYRALCYADVFDFPLTLEEMQRFSIRTGKTISESEVQKKVKRLHGYYYLQGRATLVAKRERGLQIVKQKRTLARQAARFFGIFPTISAVFITGGLAVGNVVEKDDIDFMIVTKPGWLWTTRFFVVALSKILGRYTHKRRTRSEATLADANTWCLNFWVDESALEVPKRFRNLYTAHEVMQATPIFDRSHIAEQFLSKNAWTSAFLVGKTRKVRVKNIQQTTPSLLERCFFFLQRAAVGKKQSYVRVARFFPKDTGPFVLNTWKNRI
jgi:hypothetical protein